MGYHDASNMLMCDYSTEVYLFRSCLIACDRSGCVGEQCIPGCTNPAVTDPSASNNGEGSDGGSAVPATRLVTSPMELRVLQWDCASECKYQCMIGREQQKAVQGLAPEKYDGKWPFTRFLGIQVRNGVNLTSFQFIASEF